MIKRLAMVAAMSAVMVGGVALQSTAASARGLPRGYSSQDSYPASYCQYRPAGFVCVRFDDGFIMLVQDSIVGWSKTPGTLGTVQTAKGVHANYQHILGTNLVATATH